MNGLAGWLAIRLLNYAADKIIEKIKGPRLFDAFQRACEKAIKEHKRNNEV
jgi:hypothetical protein